LLKERLNFFIIQDETTLALDLDTIAKQCNLKGLFVKNLIDNQNDNINKLALEYGIQALENKKINID
jgi:hypothetical protein